MQDSGLLGNKPSKQSGLNGLNHDFLSAIGVRQKMTAVPDSFQAVDRTLC